jgi:multiple sugar transport system permease protein
MTRTERRNLVTGILFTLPWTLGLLAFTVFPATMSLGLSFCDYSLLNEPAFVGGQNYRDLAVDNVFHTTLWNTGVYAVMALPFGMVLAIGLALLLNQQIVARPAFRTVFFLPSLVPLVALAILWNWLLQGESGALNQVLGFVGIKGPNWLGDAAWSKPALVMTGLWGVGNAVVIYLAGLQDVPRDFYEAARVDGANWWQQTWHITLPMISPVIYFNLLMGCIGVLQIFAVPFVMTNGGPMRSTLFYTMYLYQQAFKFLNMGYACAMAWILFMLVALLTWTAHRLTRRHVYYGGA